MARGPAGTVKQGLSRWNTPPRTPPRTPHNVFPHIYKHAEKCPKSISYILEIHYKNKFSGNIPVIKIIHFAALKIALPKLLSVEKNVFF